jgi:hypothetical protein
VEKHGLAHPIVTSVTTGQGGSHAKQGHGAARQGGSAPSQGTGITKHRKPGELRMVPSDEHDVLYLHARWGDSPFVTEYSWGALKMALPRPLIPAKVYRLTSRSKTIYREGSQALFFNSLHVVGEVRVVGVRAGSVRLALKLRADRPDVDRLGRGSVPIRGTVRAHRASRPSACP